MDKNNKIKANQKELRLSVEMKKNLKKRKEQLKARQKLKNKV